MIDTAAGGRTRRVLTRVTTHPVWALEQARQVIGRRHAGRPIVLSECESLLATEDDAVMRVTGLDPARYRKLRDSLWLPLPEPETRTAWESRLVLLRVVGTIVRALRPDVMIETGVERGYSSSVTLAAMRENGGGRLYSIDLPPLEGGEGFTGAAVPDELRDRWTLRLGSSRTVLPELVSEVARVDVFLHDADHTYRSQLAEYRAVWPALREGGVLISDDVWNSALLDFAAEVGEQPLLIRRWDDHDAIGLLRKGSQQLMGPVQK